MARGRPSTCAAMPPASWVDTPTTASARARAATLGLSSLPDDARPARPRDATRRNGEHCRRGRHRRLRCSVRRGRGGCRWHGAAGVRDVAAGVHGRIAVQRRQRRRLGWLHGGRAQQLAVARRPQRGVRADDGTRSRRTAAATLVAAQLTIDESTAMATAQTMRRQQAGGVLGHGDACLRVLEPGHARRGAAGEAIDPETLGLDAALPAGFVAMLGPQFRTRNGRQVAILGALMCLVRCRSCRSACRSCARRRRAGRNPSGARAGPGVT